VCARDRPATDALQHATRLLGDEHSYTIGARGRLAFAYWQAGTADATELEQRVLADSQRLLGDEHPHTLSARANLAGAYRLGGTDRSPPSACSGRWVCRWGFACEKRLRRERGRFRCRGFSTRRFRHPHG